MKKAILILVILIIGLFLFGCTEKDTNNVSDNNTVPDNNQTCIENWDCPNWSSCENSTQTRTCNDLAKCETIDNKPVETQNCVEDVPCIEEWNCIDWSECTNENQTRTCTDTENCGTSNNKPIENQNCTSEECVENWSCTDWTTCTWIDGQLPNQTRTCTDTTCETNLNKPIETQNCCYTKYYDWDPNCYDGKQRRSVDIVGCSQAEWDNVVSERSCTSIEPQCTETDSGEDYYTAGITTDIYGADYPDSCAYGNVSEWFCEPDQSLGYTNYDCEFDCQDNACVTPPTTCTNGDNYCPTNCTYQTDNDCGCTVDSDCLTANTKAAAICEESFDVKTCIDSTVPQLVQVSGDLDSFCTSYVNNCQQSAILDLDQGTNGITDLQLQVDSLPDQFSGCNIKLLWGSGNNYVVDFWVELGNNVDACKHNVPIYFYNSINTMCGSTPCFGEYP